MEALIRRPEGRIDMDTAAGLIAWLDDAAPQGGVVRLDMSGVSDADSAALALLLEWRRRLARRDVRLDIAGMPPGLTALTRLYGLEDMFLPAVEPTP
ncbi:STAS domain-containing protein [Paludibacterium paludis]|uniref:STAS domain-containing protein n=1 Tax=Paludibacterium paludis TaxID=1225769 RepID=A0A918P631_9NEIS|nr:STAS domain-containing protein [Paludibacterium paludis]GGY29128.1 hypothetical protein GCM10011289_35270 [Paludibacterium paludis]